MDSNSPLFPPSSPETAVPADHEAEEALAAQKSEFVKIAGAKATNVFLCFKAFALDHKRAGLVNSSSVLCKDLTESDAFLPFADAVIELLPVQNPDDLKSILGVSLLTEPSLSSLTNTAISLVQTVRKDPKPTPDRQYVLCVQAVAAANELKALLANPEKALAYYRPFIAATQKGRTESNLLALDEGRRQLSLLAALAPPVPVGTAAPRKPAAKSSSPWAKSGPGQ